MEEIEPAKSRFRHAGRIVSPATALIALLSIYAFSLINWFVPILRFQYALLNYLALTLALLLPILLSINGLRFKNIWLKAISLIVFIPLGIASGLIALLIGVGTLEIINDGYDASFERIKTIETKNFRIAVFRTNGGATTDYGIVLRQELKLLPGLNIVRELHNQYRCQDLEYRELDEESIEVNIECRESTRLVLKPKRFLYF